MATLSYKGRLASSYRLLAQLHGGISIRDRSKDIGGRCNFQESKKEDTKEDKNEDNEISLNIHGE